MSSDHAVVLSDVLKRFGTVVAVDHVSIQIHDGEFFSLLGPSGCGKTTTLRMIAGFESPTSGDIFISGMLQHDRPAYQRPVNTVFQHYALFPHMTVAQNVSFGLEMKGVASKEIRRQVGEALDMVQMNGMEERRPIQLSGGQQQRVALARALINRPKVLLLDEPLGSLDLKLRKAMQVELKALQNQVGITFIYVTHDQEEAMIMSDRIGVMKDGHVLQVDTPMEIYEQPRNRFVADFIGETNFIPGRVKELGQPIVVSLMGGFQVPAGIAEEGILPGDQAVVSIRPEKLHLFALDHVPDGQDRVTARLRGSVIQMIYLGTDTRYVVLLDGGVNLVARMQNVNGTETRFHSGDSVEVRWEANHARVLKE